MVRTNISILTGRTANDRNKRKTPTEDTMRDYITVNTTVKKIANGFFLPITKREVEILNVHPGDDLIVEVKVAQRFGTEVSDELNDE